MRVGKDRCCDWSKELFPKIRELLRVGEQTKMHRKPIHSRISFWFLHHETDPITSWIPQLAMDPFQGRGRECPWWLEGWDVVKWWVILEWWKYASCVGGQEWGCNDYDCMTMNMTMTNDCLYHYDYGYEILLLTFKPYQLLVLARGQRRRMWGWIVQCWQGLVVSFSFRGSKQKRINIMERELKTINLSIYIMYCVTYCIYIYLIDRMICKQY